MESLFPYIYHEKQQEGSMLCAQHALNSMLQGNYFTAPDLSAIASSLDTMEQSYDDNNRGTSTNMDDTGFFSVQVLENALHVWGLSLLRWRSEVMRPYQDRPHTQLGFILNLNQHWFTLRRFGTALSNPDLDQGQGHWFNLNSFLSGPEWVGKLYLSMVLQQAEEEGYSVFVVMQTDPEAPLALPRTEADDIASTIPDQTSAPSVPTSSSSRVPPGTIEGFEGEDMELQAALQASLMNQDEDMPSPLSASAIFPHSEPGLESPLALPVPPPLMGPGGARRSRPMVTASQTPTPPHLEEVLEVDPVAASMARNRAIMERMQREQQMAFQETYEDVDMEAVERRRRELHEEEEMVQRAITESEVLHKQANDTVEDESEPQHIPMRSDEPRVYDDEDAELQAALRASLEDAPEGYQPRPESPPPRMVPPPTDRGLSARLEKAETPDGEDPETASETSSVVAPEEEKVTMEEMRRRRLARFGA